MSNVARALVRPLCAAAVSLGLMGGALAQQTYKWNMPVPYADGSFHTKNTRAFADEIRQATNGRLDITVHSNGSLFKLPEIKRALQTGQVPIAESNLPTHGNEYPFFDIEVILFLVDSYEGALKLTKLSRPYVEQRLLSQGIEILYTVPFPGMGMISKKPVHKLEDLKGTKFRAFGPAAVRFGAIVGATPTVIQASELAQAFTTGIVDSTLTSASTGVATQAWDYAKYFVDLNAAHSKDTIMVNQAAFRALPEDIQAAVRKAAANAEVRGLEWSKKEHEETKARLEKEGMIIIKPDAAFKAELAKLGEAMAEDWEKRAGPVGAAVLQASRL